MKIARHFSAGKTTEDEAQSPVGTEESTPHISFVIFDFIFSKVTQILFLEAPYAVMILLTRNIRRDIIGMRRSNAKCTIALLPGELF